MMGTPKTSEGCPNSKFLAVLDGNPAATPPIWLMRQAGRYLPEYRRVRAKADGFLNLCYTPKLAAEVTLQPIRRYDFDAAILFSDILVLPHALGQDVWFVDGEGPRLEPIATAADIARLKPQQTDEKFGLVFESVSKIRAALSSEKALIGFSGAPWTVATYIVAGRGTSDQADARTWAYREPIAFQNLIDIISETTISYLSGQIEAGVNAVQIFDSWAGPLPDDELERWVVAPTRRIVEGVRSKHPNVPIIGFPRGAGLSVLHYARQTGIQAIGCDTALPLSHMRDVLAPAGLVLQGNLDPLLLVVGGDRMRARIEAILQAMHGKPFVFNLGHGIVPQTPPEHVAEMVRIVREWSG
ncbi:MAG: uroporphyrinogen decarboxylase [Hyphomicrobiaceae bacterium]